MSETELHFLTISETAREIAAKRISPVELTKVYLERIGRLNPILNAYLTVTAEHALQQARNSEAEILKGNYRGSLHGIPIALKDLFDTEGILTTAGSKILRDRVPDNNCDVVSRLSDSGAILLGKLNMHEFAFGITNINPHYGPTRNPWGTNRITGGSSGGSAAATSAGMCAGALGSDTGGSIRIPACFCGIVGLKPTYGRISKRGVIPLSGSLDHVGPMTRTVEDAAIILQAIAGYDPKDENSMDVPVPDYSKFLTESIEGMRIGVLSGDYLRPVDIEVDKALKKVISTLKSLGAVVMDTVEFPYIGDALDPNITIISAEAAEYHQANLDKHPADYGDSVFERLQVGRQLLATQYIHAKRMQQTIREKLLEGMSSLDALFLPMMPLEAPPIGDEHVIVSGQRLDIRSAVTWFTQPFNLTGFPAISVPCGFTSAGLPIGFQLASKPYQEGKLLRIGHAYERVTSWHTKHPAV